MSSIPHLDVHINAPGADPHGEVPIVRLLRTFRWHEHTCLVFELLSYNMFELLKMNGFNGVSLNLVRKFGRSMLCALHFLAQQGLMHCDVKPENIMLVGPKSAATKLADFGCAARTRGAARHPRLPRRGAPPHRRTPRDSWLGRRCTRPRARRS